MTTQFNCTPDFLPQFDYAGWSFVSQEVDRATSYEEENDLWAVNAFDPDGEEFRNVYEVLFDGNSYTIEPSTGFHHIAHVMRNRDEKLFDHWFVDTYINAILDASEQKMENAKIQLEDLTTVISKYVPSKEKLSKIPKLWKQEGTKCFTVAKIMRKKSFIAAKCWSMILIYMYKEALRIASRGGDPINELELTYENYADGFSTDDQTREIVTKLIVDALQEMIREAVDNAPTQTKISV